MLLLRAAMTPQSAQPRIPLAVGCGALLLGCGVTVEDPASAQQAVVKGTVSPAEQNAVVVVRHKLGDWGTGSIVAPSLVLTSKRLLFEDARDDERFYCYPGPSGVPVTQVLDPKDFTVMFGDTFPMEHTARGKRVLAGPDLDACRSEIVLLEIDRSFPIAPLPLRLLDRPQPGERGLIVGWGMSDASNDAPPGSAFSVTGNRYQKDLTIAAVGAFPFPLESEGSGDVPDLHFTTDVGGCYGDGGAPFLSSGTGAIVGTLSMFEPEDWTLDHTLSPLDCERGQPTFHAISAERDWLIEAFRDAGAAPWLEGLSEPGPSGAACTVNEECASGHCLGSRSRTFCSMSCESEPCTAGEQCLLIDGGRWCVPERLGSGDGDDASCAVSRGRPWMRAWNPVPALFLFLAVRLSRNRSGRRSTCDRVEERRSS
jgi:hypothetical protein